jgi:hypothetical protein
MQKNKENKGKLSDKVRELRRLRYSISKKREHIATYLKLGGAILAEVKLAIIDELNNAVDRPHGNSDPWKDYQFYRRVQKRCSRGISIEAAIADLAIEFPLNGDKVNSEVAETILLSQDTATSTYLRGKKISIDRDTAGEHDKVAEPISVDEDDCLLHLRENRLDALWEEFLITGRPANLAAYISHGGEIDTRVRKTIIQFLEGKVGLAKDNKDQKGDVNFYIEVKSEQVIDGLVKAVNEGNTKMKSKEKIISDKASAQYIGKRGAKEKYLRGKKVFREVFEKK